MGYEILFLYKILGFYNKSSVDSIKNCNNFVIKKCLKILYYPNYL